MRRASEMGHVEGIVQVGMRGVGSARAEEIEAARSPGGLTYTETIDLIAGVGRRAWIVGFDIVELAPDADVGNLSALTAARLVTNAIGTVVRQG